MAGTWIDIGGGMSGYLAVPESGSGPGIVLLQEIFGVNSHMRAVADFWAEEGYVVLAPDMFHAMEQRVQLGYDGADFEKAFNFYGRFDEAAAIEDMKATVAVLKARPECTGKVGAMGFCLGGKLAWLAAAHAGVDAAVGYYGVGIENALDLVPSISCKVTLHFGELDKFVPAEARDKIAAATKGKNVEIFVYQGADHGFNCNERHAFDPGSALMAHTRSLTTFRQAMGPHYDLSALWEEHTYLEFGARDAGATMKTMVAEPYVNHIPTMTGGVGQAHLHRFYKYHFIPKTPADTKLVPVSRTIGVDRIVDEMLFCFTHDIEIDWMLPGVAPTGKYVEIPLIAVVHFRGPKLYNEHIYWDQASVLVQIGLLDPKLLPVAGIETAKKVLDKSLPSNTLMKKWSESEGKPL
jgi:carboxymethylenebutenolidase